MAGQKNNLFRNGSNMLRNLGIIFILSLLACGNSRVGSRGQNVDSLLRAMQDELPCNIVDLQADTLICNGVAFPAALFLEAAAGERVASVVHYGDSHINAGYLGRVLRVGLQSRFGNSGFGFVTPYGLAGGYEPFDYKVGTFSSSASASSVSSGEVMCNGLVDRSPLFAVGASGYSLRMKGGVDRVDFRVSVNAKSAVVPGLSPMALDYGFDRVRVIHDSLGPMVTVMPAERLLDYPDGVDGGEQPWAPYVTNLDLRDRGTAVDLVAYAAGRYGSDGGVAGFSLENGRPGVLYHPLGVSSACFLHWARAEGALAQGAALQGDVIIVSLGSNEAAGYNFNDQVFYDQMHRMVSSLRRYNSQAVFVLTTPVQVYGRARRGASMLPNANYARVRDVILRYGAENGVIVFDMYGVAGGDGGRSAERWQECGLLRRDKLHFTEQGYTLQGLMLLNAIIKEIDKR